MDLVTFTGSTAVGKSIAVAATGTLKKVALERGGKNPQVIFPDADMDSAADAVTFGTYFNAGECCNSGSQIIVHEDIAQDFTARVVALSRRVAFGDPLNEATQVGAIALANDAAYGLSAGVWSENVHTCLDFARRVQAGTIWTKPWMDGFPEMTFGGMKQSGLGREIGSYGLAEFLEVKTVAMRVWRTRTNWVR